MTLATPALERPDVLVVEDHPTTRRLMSTWLEMSGYRVTQATDGSDAWQSAESSCPPIVVTDWNMPELSGLELCRHIREFHDNNQVYVLIATSRDSGDDLTQAMEAGANDFVSKPIQEHEFLARIRGAEMALQRLQSQTKLAEMDPLTGLLNRRTLLAKGQQLLTRSRRDSTRLTCVMLDIDLFKKFNDEQGHAAGDRILIAVARCLEQECREQDLICRMGGDEFCLLLADTDEAEAIEVAERIRNKLAAEPVLLANSSVTLRVTLGIAPLSHNVDRISSIIDSADRVLLAAKNDGRNRSLSMTALRQRRSDFQADTIGSHPKLRSTLASDIMNESTVLVFEDQTIRSAIDIIVHSDSDCACVVDRTSKLTGMISERDLLNALATGTVADVRVRTIMNSNFARFHESTQILKIWESLQRTPMLRNVVIDEYQSPVGLVSRRALLKLLRTLDD